MPVNLSHYFDTDDGSLPEIEVSFANPVRLPIAFQLLYDRGARNVTVDGGHIWLKAAEAARPLSGPEDAHLVLSGEADAFHVVLGGIVGFDCTIPDLGVFVFPDSLVFDYRMGPGWRRFEIHSLLHLLRGLRELGGTISVPWWGPDGERDFQKAIG